MTFENRPKPPVISSLAGALDQVNHWLRANRMDEIRDADGLPWRLTVKTHQVPHQELPKALIWHVAVSLATTATAADLVKTGTLDPQADARTIALIGAEAVPLVMKPLKYRVNNEDEARTLIAQVVPNLKASLGRSPLDDTKRRLVARWVDQRRKFGQALA